ncbi:hypothetical protein J6590_053577 [Homalodisca vitripennis]|nr:hypothetical protein J6590_053577 [Homalodisca vitripennis]
MSDARCSSFDTTGIAYTVIRHGSHKPFLTTCQTPGAVATAHYWRWLNCKPTWFTKSYYVNMSDARCSSHTSGIGYTVSRHGSHKAILPTCQTPGAVVTALNWIWLNYKPIWFTKTYSVNMTDARCSSHGTQLELAKL